MEKSSKDVKSESVLSSRVDGAEFLLDPKDPMNWSWLMKHSILACISVLGGLGTYAGLFIVPA